MIFRSKSSDEIRKELKNKYYLNWSPKNNVFKVEEKQITDDLLIGMYNEYIEKLNSFLEEINRIAKKITKTDFVPNFRQTGGYDRCVVNYPDTGWKEKYHQYIQAYKELMVDFICYEPLEYDELSLKEIGIIKEMAQFLIKQAQINIDELSK